MPLRRRGKTALRHGLIYFKHSAEQPLHVSTGRAASGGISRHPQTSDISHENEFVQRVEMSKQLPARAGFVLVTSESS